MVVPKSAECNDLRRLVHSPHNRKDTGIIPHSYVALSQDRVDPTIHESINFTSIHIEEPHLHVQDIQIEIRQRFRHTTHGCACRGIYKTYFLIHSDRSRALISAVIISNSRQLKVKKKKKKLFVMFKFLKLLPKSSLTSLFSDLFRLKCGSALHNTH